MFTGYRFLQAIAGAHTMVARHAGARNQRCVQALFHLSAVNGASPVSGKPGREKWITSYSNRATSCGRKDCNGMFAVKCWLKAEAKAIVDLGQHVFWNLDTTTCGDLCVVASRDFAIVRRWLLPRQLGAVGVCISLRSLNAPFSVIAVKCCCRCHRTWLFCVSADDSFDFCWLKPSVW